MTINKQTKPNNDVQKMKIEYFCHSMSLTSY